ncbi:MAG: RHS repeat-associated core domain-containing protein, partial [Pseudomonadota bacterium]
YADGRLPVSMTKGGSAYYFLYDQVGTLKAVSDSSGNIIKQIDYDSFGNIISDTNPGFTVPFGFAGGLHDRDTGLVRFGYRDFDPSIGRWAAKDPIDFAGGDPNLYGYVLNDPVNLVDPFGLVNWGKLAVGVLSVTDGLTMVGVAITATVGTAVLTGNPILTGIVAIEMVPVLALGVWDIYHGIHLIDEALNDEKATPCS